MGDTGKVLANTFGGIMGASLVQQRRMAKEQRRALDLQEKTQQQQLAQARAETRRAALEERAANKKAPNIANLLSKAQADSQRGPAATMMSEQQDRMLGNRTTLLG